MNGNLYALDTNTGTARWTFSGNGAMQATPALLGSTIYAATENGTVYAINTANGTQLWQYTLPGGTPISSVPNDPSVQSAGVPARLQATTSAVVASPATAYGNVYVGSINGDLTALNGATEITFAAMAATVAVVAIFFQKFQRTWQAISELLICLH